MWGSRWSSWHIWMGVGRSVVAANSDGGAAPFDGERERSRGEGEDEGERESVKGVAWRPQGNGDTSREAGGGRRVAGARRARAPAFWREEDDDWQASWLGRARWAGPAQVRPKWFPSLSLFSVLFYFFYLTTTVELY